MAYNKGHVRRPQAQPGNRKPPLGEKRPKLRLVWENPKLSCGTQKRKSEVKPEPSYGRVLYNYFRYYDPATGRYITSDPIGLRGGLNTYTYALNNPLYWNDPFGLDVEVLVGGAHWYDHAAVRIDNTVYSNGRYRVPGRDTGSFGLTGPNVLTVQSANSYYETSDSCNLCDTTGFKLDVTPAEEAKIRKYYKDLIAKSKKHPTRSGWYILPDDYAFVGNNCASTVVDALSSGLPWYQSMSLPGVATPQTLELNLHMSPFLVDETIHYQTGQ
ncbi:MAG TPA: RHS repeat-associated core domain-containing protein [Methylothermaceae bacterium]|nr:RHS repeat-associated core domain-containing protein [Methylothermaceae bacterium]